MSISIKLGFLDVLRDNINKSRYTLSVQFFNSLGEMIYGHLVLFWNVFEKFPV